MVTNTANRPSHERVKQSTSSFQTNKKPNHEYSLCKTGTATIWHSGTMSRLSGHLDEYLDESSGTLAHF